MESFPFDYSVCLDERQVTFINPSDDAQLSPADSNGSVFLSSEAENDVDDRKKQVKQTPTTPYPLSSDADLLDSKKKRSVSRSPMFTPDITNSSKLERKKSGASQFSKTNAQYHKLFTDVSKEEPLKQSFTCALQKELLFQGKLYISENWIAFHSKVFGKDTKIAIPVLSVTMIKKTKTALLVPNALVISTVAERYIFVSLLSRDSTYKLLKSVCKHLENVSVANSPVPSSTENSFRAERPTSLPLDFSVDFSELDGMVRHRRQNMDGFSSTGSQTPESENSQGGSRLERFFHRATSQQLLSLNALLICYAVLVCVLLFSTVYMRSKIISLEERLSTMGSFFDIRVNEQSREGLAMRSLLHVNADSICDELTTNLAKLDQIQKNLQRLLEDMV